MAVQLFHGVFSDCFILCNVIFVFYVATFFICSLCDSLMMNIICFCNCVYIQTDGTAANADQNGLCHRNCIGKVANGKWQEDCIFKNYVISVAQGSVKMQGKKEENKSKCIRKEKLFIVLKTL